MMTDLDKLIEAVDDNDIDVWECLPASLERFHSLIVAAKFGSLDAAKELHEALLPGWWVQHIGHNLAGYGVRLETKGVSLPESCLLPRHACPARAWLIAILKAYRAQLEVKA